MTLQEATKFRDVLSMVIAHLRTHCPEATLTIEEDHYNHKVMIKICIPGG